MLSCAKTKLPQAEQTMKQQQRKKENFPLLYPHAYMSLETLPRMHFFFFFPPVSKSDPGIQAACHYFCFSIAYRL